MNDSGIPLDARIYVAGHRGMVGSAIVRALKVRGYHRLLLRTHAELNLCEQSAVQQFFQSEKPEYVVLAAAKVGGIMANDTYRADFIYENLAIQNNVIHQAWKAGVKRLLFLGSSCIYPKHAPQPMKEEHLLTGLLEPTNQPYAIAKIAGIEMCDAYNRQYGADFRAAMPTNLYGPGDNFDLNNSHVIPALLRKFHEAKTSSAATVTLWGSGTARREFLHVDDLADASTLLLGLSRLSWDKQIGLPLINVGCGKDQTIAELAGLIRRVVNYDGEIVYDRSKPDGTPQKLLDTSRLTQLGWLPQRNLASGLTEVYRSFKDSLNHSLLDNPRNA